MDEIKRQIEELGTAWKEFQATNAKAMAELKASGDSRGETEVKLRKLDEAIAKADEAKSAAERLVLVASRPEPDSGTVAGRVGPGARAYKEKLDQWLRKGGIHRGEEVETARKSVEEKTLSSLTDPDGGYYLSHDQEETIIRYVTETSPLRELARVVQIGNRSIRGRLRQGRAGTGGWVGEASARPVTTTPQVGEWEIVARESYAMPDAPNELLEDTVIDLEAWLRGEAEEEFSVLENTAFVNGNGVVKPRGILTYGNGTDPLQSQIEQIATATNDVFAADDLISLQQAVKEPYQLGASWLLSRQMLGNVRRFVLGSVLANYVWQPGLQLGVPSVILGQPYRLMADFPTTVVDQGLIVAYGDFRVAYTIVDRRGIILIRDNVTQKGSTLFYFNKRVGGGVTNFEAYKILRVQ